MKYLRSEATAVIGTASGVLAGLSAAVIAWNSLFLSAPQAPELLLVVSVLLVVAVTIRVWSKKIEAAGQGGIRIRVRLPLRVRLLALGVAMAWTVCAFAIWYTALRLPADVREKVDALIELGDSSYKYGLPEVALKNYQEARRLAPRNREVLSRIQKLSD